MMWTDKLVRCLFVFLLMCLVVPSVSAVTLNEIARIDVSAEFNDMTSNGASPSAVAWNGRELFVAGYNNTSDPALSVGIVRYDNVLTSPTVGPQFAQLVTPGQRGYSGLDISGDALAAAYDDGAADPNGLQLFDLNGNQQWAKEIRGGSGVAFDAGFGGADSGVAWTTFGSGRRALQNTATGADIYTTGDGMIITPDFAGSFWRNIDFAPNGDMVGRRSNDVTNLTRTGGNSGTTGFVVDNIEDGPFQNGQNVAFVYDSAAGDVVLWNFRSADTVNPANLPISGNAVLMANQFDGTPEPLNINLMGGGPLPDGVAYYDFSWDQSSGTLALLDFSNRAVHIFGVVPEPAGGLMIALAGCMLTLMARRKSHA